MDIQSASVQMSQARVQEQAGVKVAAMGLSAIKEQAAALDKLIQTADVMSDPNVGTRVNLTA
jgi:hypothetical protein